MKQAILGIFTIIVFAGLGVANAQTFAFEGTSSEPTRVGGIGPDHADYDASYWSGVTNVVVANGEKFKSAFTCISMEQPPSANIFDSHVACDSKSANGAFSGIFGCYPLNQEKTELSCVGGLSGKAGAYENRSGAMTIHVKGTVSKGVGQWFE